MTLTSCYFMASTPASSPISMVSLVETINSIDSSIYRSSTITFVNDSDAFATTDINQTNILNIANNLLKFFDVIFVPNADLGKKKLEGQPYRVPFESLLNS